MACIVDRTLQVPEDYLKSQVDMLERTGPSGGLRQCWGRIWQSRCWLILMIGPRGLTGGGGGKGQSATLCNHRRIQIRLLQGRCLLGGLTSTAKEEMVSGRNGRQKPTGNALFQIGRRYGHPGRVSGNLSSTAKSEMGSGRSWRQTPWLAYVTEVSR